MTLRVGSPYVVDGRRGELPALRVGTALPDPPFELQSPSTNGVTGFDPAMMQAVATVLGREMTIVRYRGEDFEGIFAGLDRDEYDVVASGATVTDHRRTLVRFCRPYVSSGQSLVVNVETAAAVRSTDDLAGRVLGVQRGNTSEPVADALLAAGRLGGVQRYPYHGILDALDHIESGAIDGFMKLEPVMRWLVKDRPRLRIVQTRITTEALAVAVARDDAALAVQIDAALDSLRADGRLGALGHEWLGTGEPGSGTAVVT